MQDESLKALERVRSALERGEGHWWPNNHGEDGIKPLVEADLRTLLAQLEEREKLLRDLIDFPAGEPEHEAARIAARKLTLGKADHEG